MFKPWLLSIFILSGLTLFGQLDRFRHLSTADGLPENTGQAIIQDRQGFVWIGTQNGLTRYDGYQFKTYQHNPGVDSSLSNNQVESLYEDSDGYLWVSTRNGLNRFDPYRERFEAFLPDTSEAFNQNWFSYSILEDHQGHIWASTRFGFYEFENWDKGEFNYYPATTDRPTSLGYDSQKQKLFGVYADSLFELGQGRKKFLIKLPSNTYSLKHCDDGLLIGTENGVYVYHDSLVRRLPWMQSTAGQLILGFYEDNKGSIWILGNQGLTRVTVQGSITQWQHEPDRPESLSHNLCLSLLEDNQGLLWIGTGQGVNILDPLQDQFMRLGINTGQPIPLPDPHVEAIHFSDSLNLWIGTASGLLHLQFKRPFSMSQITPSDWPLTSSRVYRSENQKDMPDDNIDFITSEKSGRLWVGTAGGKLFSLDPETRHLRQHPTPDNLAQLRGISNRFGFLWLGFAGGLRLMIPGSDSIFKPAWLPEIKVVQFGWSDDHLWVGSPRGLFIIDPENKSWRKISAGSGKEELPNTMITHLLNQRDDLWLCSFGGGLYHYNKRNHQFRVFTESEGLVNNNIWAAYVDNEGMIWLSTDHGISRFDPGNQEFINFGRSDGLNFEDFSMTAHAQAPGGEILFGNPRGMTVFQPARVKSSSFLPPLACTSIEVNYHERPDLLRKTGREDERIELYPGDQTISFNFAVLSFRQPLQNRYAFKLENYDENWVYRRADKRTITYTDLPPGDYQLLVKGSGGKELWNNDLLSIPLRVIPPFYLTWWFRTLVLLLLLLLVGSLVYYINQRRYQRRIRQLKMQQEIQGERERISRDLHDNVGAHLTKIITDLDLLSLQLENKPVEANVEQIESTRGFTQNTVRLLRDTIWAINQDEFSLVELAEKTRDYLSQYLGDFIDWQVESSFEGRRTLRPNEVMNILRIVQEATQNMLKYAKASHYHLHLSFKEKLRLEIEDDGVGFSTAKNNGAHYGLKNMQYRAREIGGELSIDSTPGSGTRLTLTL